MKTKGRNRENGPKWSINEKIYACSKWVLMIFSGVWGKVFKKEQEKPLKMACWAILRTIFSKSHHLILNMPTRGIDGCQENPNTSSATDLYLSLSFSSLSVMHSDLLQTKGWIL